MRQAAVNSKMSMHLAEMEKRLGLPWAKFPTGITRDWPQIGTDTVSDPVLEGDPFDAETRC